MKYLFLKFITYLKNLQIARTPTIDMLQYKLLREEVSKLSKLKPGWDGAGSLQFSPILIKNVKDFITRMEAYKVPVPELYTCGDEEIGFKWRAWNEQRATVSFFYIDSITGYCTVKQKDTLQKLDCIYNSEIFNSQINSFFDCLRMSFGVFE